MSASKGSLSSVVSSLVRAQHGAPADEIPADDLDAYVADMLLKEAKEREARWGKEGVKAYFSDEEQDGPARKTNKRFLNAMLKNVDDHNQALLRSEREASAGKIAESSSRKQAPGPSGSRLFALAKTGMSSKPNLNNGKSRRSENREPRSKNREPTPEKDEKRSRANRYYENEDDDRSYRSKSRKYYSDEEDERHSSSRHRSSRRGRSRSRDRDRDRDTNRSSRKRVESDVEQESTSKRKSSKSKRADKSDDSADEERASHHRSRRKRDNDDEDDNRERRERSHRRSRRYSYSDEENEEEYRRRKRSRRSEKERDDRSRSVEPIPPPKKVVAPLPVPRVQAPSRSPTPPSRDQDMAPDFPASRASGGESSSKMDKYFHKNYDPRLDVSVADLTDTNGFIGEGNFDEWSRMMEVLKVRKEEKAYREREREEQKQMEKEKKADAKRQKKIDKARKERRRLEGTSSEEEGPKIKTRPLVNDYKSATGGALLTIGGYAKKKSKTEWGSGPDLSF